MIPVCVTCFRLCLKNFKKSFLHCIDVSVWYSIKNKICK